MKGWADFKWKSLRKDITIDRFDSKLNVSLKLKLALMDLLENNANSNASQGACKDLREVIRHLSHQTPFQLQELLSEKASLDAHFHLQAIIKSMLISSNLVCE